MNEKIITADRHTNSAPAGNVLALLDTAAGKGRPSILLRGKP